MGYIIMVEIWKDIEGWEGYYQISNTGKVKSLERQIFNKRYENVIAYKTVKEKILKQPLDRGYRCVGLSKDSTTKTKMVHILIAKAFIPNPFNKPFVNHINGVRNDNRIENLEWCTARENVTHGYRVLKRSSPNKGKMGSDSIRAKSVLQFSKNDGKFIAEYEGVLDAYRKTGLIKHQIYASVKGLDVSSHEYIWIYKTDLIIEI